MWAKYFGIVGLFSALLMPLPGFAEQRALLVGVGKYLNPANNLPGIDLDLERMRETLRLMGFEDRQMHTLMDEQATSTKVIAEMTSWLTSGVQPDDRVVFYFSGHGSQIPDAKKADGVDEVLVTHDMRFTRVNGQASLAGVLADVKIGELLAKIPSKNIWVVVDSCHSGTITRSFSMSNRSLGSGPVYVKSLTYPGMPIRKRTAVSRDLTRAPIAGVNYVTLTAAADDERAIGTSNGGIFTIGLTEAIKRLSTEGKSITVNGLRKETADYIAAKVDKEQVHHPQVEGNPDLANGTLKIVPINPQNGPNRKKLLDLVAAQSNHFEITASSMKYAVDEPVKLTLTLPVAGYLNLVSVDAQDNATVLFPNHYQESNAVKAGVFAVPTPQMAFDLLAAEPLGPTLVVAFISADPINFYQETLDNRDEKGNINADFSSLSHTATRAIRVTPRKNETYGAKLELQITAAK
jgi:metacaspase-1